MKQELKRRVRLQLIAKSAAAAPIMRMFSPLPRGGLDLAVSIIEEAVHAHARTLPIPDSPRGELDEPTSSDLIDTAADLLGHGWCDACAKWTRFDSDDDSPSLCTCGSPNYIFDERRLPIAAAPQLVELLDTLIRRQRRRRRK